MSVTSETDEKILCDLLVRGNNAPKNIAEEIGTSREYVSERLKVLEEEDLVRRVGSGVWSLSLGGVRYSRRLDCCERDFRST